MRHGGAGIDARFALLLLLAQTPPTRSLSMFGATSAAALIPLSGGALTVSAHCIGASLATVALAAVAAPAQHNLLATASAQEQATYGIDQAHSSRRLAADAPCAAHRPAVIVATTKPTAGPTSRPAPAWPP